MRGNDIVAIDLDDRKAFFPSLVPSLIGEPFFHEID
jgi:hypothetical protein